MKKIIFTILLFGIFLYPLFKPALYASHDGEAHLARFAAYHKAFSDGHIPPRFAGNLNFGYGTPIFIFYYPLPGYIASAMHFFGIELEHTFRTLMILSFILTPYFCYLWLKNLFSKYVALAGSLLYGFSPYHFLDLYVRGDVAEMIAFTFVPLVFLFIEKYLKKPDIKKILIGGIFYALLILSHNGISLMFSPVFLLYIIVRSKNKKDFINLLPMIFFGLLLSAFFWIPALWEGKYVNTDVFIGSMYKNHFPKLMELFYSSWGFGANIRDAGGLSPQIGIIPMFIAAGGIIAFLTRKKKDKFLRMWIVVFISSIFITLSVSSFAWENLRILRLFEFPWRFTALSSFAASMIGCCVLALVKNKKFTYILLTVFLISVTPFIKVAGFKGRDDNYYKNFTGTTYYHGEANPIWTAGDPESFAKSQVEIISGDAKVSNIKKKSHIHTYEIEAIEKSRVLDNTQYFPGWKVKVNDTKVPIQFQDPDNRGLITFDVPEGKNRIEAKFTESPIRLLSDLMSVFGLILLIAFFAYAKTINVIYNKLTKSLI